MCVFHLLYPLLNDIAFGMVKVRFLKTYRDERNKKKEADHEDAMNSKSERLGSAKRKHVPANSC